MKPKVGEQLKSEKKKKKMMRTFCFAAPKGDRKNMISFHPVAAVSKSMKNKGYSN